MLHRTTIPLLLALFSALAMTVLAQADARAAEGETSAAAAEGETSAAAAERPGRTGYPLPRYVSLRADEVNLRTGPGVRYPIEWIYRRRGLPVEIVEEFEAWRRIRDWQGTLGWVHRSMLQGRRTVLVVGAERRLRRRPQDDATAVARLEAGSIGELQACLETWCQVELAGHLGWLRRDEFYGAYPGEVIE
jgi:SH3-like domain-containing protein